MAFSYIHSRSIAQGLEKHIALTEYLLGIFRKVDILCFLRLLIKYPFLRGYSRHQRCVQNEFILSSKLGVMFGWKKGNHLTCGFEIVPN